MVETVAEEVNRCANSKIVYCILQYYAFYNNRSFTSDSEQVQFQWKISQMKAILNFISRLKKSNGEWSALQIKIQKERLHPWWQWQFYLFFFAVAINPAISKTAWYDVWKE